MKTFKPNHTPAVLIQLGYEELITEPGDVREDLYCLTMPQTKALIAIIEIYRYKTRWFHEDEIDSDLIERFTDDTQRRLMMPCGSDNIITITQFTVEGHFQVSLDGGNTFNDAPGSDPRNGQSIPPPFVPPDTVSESCMYADSILNLIINEWINITSDTEDAASVADGINHFIRQIFGETIALIVAPLVLAISVTILAFTIAAWKAAFTSDDFDKLRCNLNDHQGSDGTFTQTNVDDIYSQLSSDHTGIVLLSFRTLIAAIGWQGLTIAAHSGHGRPDATCDCTCLDPCTVDWTFFGVDDVVKISDCHYTMTVNGIGHFAFTSGDQALGCYYAFSPNLTGFSSIWPVGSASPVGGTDPKMTPIWNYDTADFATSTMLDLVFSSAPIP